MSPEEEKRQNRGYIVWSILIGGVLSFLVNIFANIYYGIFITKTLSFDKIDNTQVIFCALLFVALVGYLSFFIYDYPNTFEFSKNYWKRYSDYFFYKFGPGKILRVLVGVYLLFTLLALYILFYLTSVHIIGILYGTIIFVLIIPIATYIRVKRNGF